MAEVIVALDLKTREEAEAAVDRLPGVSRCVWLEPC